MSGDGPPLNQNEDSENVKQPQDLVPWLLPILVPVLETPVLFENKLRLFLNFCLLVHVKTGGQRWLFLDQRKLANRVFV